MSTNGMKPIMGELKCKLEKFKNITIELKRCIENEDYDNMEVLLNRRQELIDSLSQLEYTREDFTKVCDEYGIIKLQNEVKNLMNEKKLKVRSEIEKLAASKNANKNYGKKFTADSIFFNKKI